MKCQRRTTPYWPQASGHVEHQNQTLLKALQIAYLEVRELEKELWSFLLVYRTTPHTRTVENPAEPLCDCNFRTIFKHFCSSAYLLWRF